MAVFMNASLYPNLPTVTSARRLTSVKRILVWQMLFALIAPAADFEAVSIKPSPSGVRGSGYNLTPGRLRGKNQALRDIVQFAWGVQGFQVTGGPAWAGSDHYEILATFPGETNDAERKLMLQRMLADRFGLIIHKDSKEVSGYALVVSRDGVRFGQAASEEHSLVMGRSATTGQRTLTATSTDMAGLAGILAYALGQPVGDKTDLAARYDFAMEWSPDETSAPLSKSGERPEPIAQTGPSIFTAIQGLGLTLRPQKIATEIIVIDQASKPSEN